jgi:DNA-binding response OmpR family regulator
VFINEKEILLSPTAYRMLSYLAINAGKVITANQLLDEVWGEKYFGDTHIVQVGMVMESWG